MVLDANPTLPLRLFDKFDKLLISINYAIMVLLFCHPLTSISFFMEEL